MSDFDPEQYFPPRPGGMVDTVRKQKQAEQVQAAALPEVTAGGNGDYAAVRVRVEDPDLGTARTVTLSSANPVAQLLPRDNARRSAIIVAVDNDVWLSYNEGTAGDLSGTSGAGSAFYLPVGIGIPINSRAQLWVSPTTTATSSRVSVLVTKDSMP